MVLSPFDTYNVPETGYPVNKKKQKKSIFFLRACFRLPTQHRSHCSLYRSQRITLKKFPWFLLPGLERLPLNVDACWAKKRPVNLTRHATCLVLVARRYSLPPIYKLQHSHIARSHRRLIFHYKIVHVASPSCCLYITPLGLCCQGEKQKKFIF